ncbi:MAG TPA: SDR family NAD(P)-dependent oxidoreductase, partial [Burkholderiaceae bacterium]|nr:SDR family NAD(P)-dependent oxidoreductase [Burkholderiaceae bacterium]
MTAAAERVGVEFGRLDVLVNNAGIGDALDGAPSAADIEAIRRIFDTNFFGTLAVTQAMLPLLRRSSAARIVNVSSLIGSLAAQNDPASPVRGFPLPAYGVSKTAVNAWTVQLANELQDTPIKVNAVHPGSVKTDMNSVGDLDV